MTHIATPEQLDRAYRYWCIWHRPRYTRLFVASYQYIARQSETAQQFEAWLFEQGGKVFQQDKQRYIKFDNVEDYTSFVLTNA